MKQQELLFLIVFTFIVVLSWTGFSIYHAARTSTITQEQATVIKPIAPTFDQQTIQALKDRAAVQPLYSATAVTVSSSQSAQTTFNSQSLIAPLSQSAAANPGSFTSPQTLQGGLTVPGNTQVPIPSPQPTQQTGQIPLVP